MPTLEQAVADICGRTVRSSERLAGGDISGASRIVLSDGSTLVAKGGPLVDREARMIEEIRALGAPVPTIVGQKDGWLVLGDVGPSQPFNGRAWDAIAEALDPLRGAAQHEDFGWPEDYGFHRVTVSNTRHSNWIDFWRENRLLCHLPELAPELARRVEALAARLGDLIPDRPPVALVHGDLWGGNVVWNGTRASLIDPCAYYGDREVDAAAMTVFDGPPRALFDRLDLSPGWRERLPVYRLWMWLIHIRLFGEGYRPAAEGDLDRLGF
ncbi:fructosamine kinase family protein [Qipengyuania mesophila]|uniref:fructosamine kinase family protein n=1 Tax=Qipengyuania mesophila TaxID=2867246 RepID=UPI003513D603